MDAAQMIEKILAWAVGKPHFDKAYIEELHAKTAKGITLTDAEVAVLENIMARFLIS